MKSRKKRNLNVIIYRVLFILLILVGTSARLVTGNIAKYSSTVEATSSSGFIAVFAPDAVKGMSWSDSVSLAPEESHVWEVSVNNFKTVSGTDVLTQVTTDITLEAENIIGNLPLKFEYSTDNSSWQVSAPTVRLGYEVKETKPIYVKVTYQGDESTDYTALSGMVDVIRFTATAIQVD